MEDLGDSQYDLELRLAISEALAKIGPQASAAIPMLLSDLKSPNGVVRGYAARVLFRIDDQLAVNQVLPQVLEDANSDDPRAQFGAVYALRSIGPVTPEAAAAIDTLKLDDKYRYAFGITP